MKVSLITHGTVIKLLTVVVDGGQDGNRVLGDINTGENSGSLRDTRKTFVENFRREMAELEVNVILLRTNTTSLTNFDGHTSRNDITGSKILRSGSIAFHETFTLRVQEVSTLTTGT